MRPRLSSHLQNNLADEVPKTSFWNQRTEFPFPQDVPVRPCPNNPTGEGLGLPQAWLDQAAMQPPPHPTAGASLSLLFEEAAILTGCKGVGAA